MVRQSLLRLGVLTPDLTDDVVLLAEVERVAAGGVHIGSSLEGARSAVKTRTRRLVVHGESRTDLVGGVALAVSRGADDVEACFSREIVNDIKRGRKKREGFFFLVKCICGREDEMFPFDARARRENPIPSDDITDSPKRYHEAASSSTSRVANRKGKK